VAVDAVTAAAPAKKSGRRMVPLPARQLLVEKTAVRKRAVVVAAVDKVPSNAEEVNK